MITPIPDPKRLAGDLLDALSDAACGCERCQKIATDHFARALMAEREACAVTAAGASAEFDFGKALAECRDSEHGFHSGRLHAASAIRDRSKT